MADEETIVSGTDDGAGSPNSGNGLTVEELQARATRAEQEAAKLRQQLDELQPYVQFGGEPEKPKPEAKPPNVMPRVEQTKPDDSELRRLKAELEQTKNLFGEVTTANFYDANPDLNEYKSWVLTAFNQTDQNKPLPTRLKEAAKAVRDQVKKIEEAAVAKVQAEKESKKKAAAATAGVVESGSTAPEAPEPSETWTENDYAAARRKEQAAIN